MKTIEECKNEVARNNNFDSFKRAVRYTFNRELLQSEEEFLNKIIDESMQLYTEQRLKAGHVDTFVTRLERRKKYWHDKARELLIGNGPETMDDIEYEDANHMYGVYIDVIADMRDFERKNG